MKSLLVSLLPLFCCCILISSSEDSNENQTEYEGMTPKLEYVDVFSSMPMVFEYVLELLEKKPEVLERNEAEVFKRDTDHQERSDTDNEDMTKPERFRAEMEKLMELVEFKIMNSQNKTF